MSVLSRQHNLTNCLLSYNTNTKIQTSTMSQLENNCLEPTGCQTSRHNIDNHHQTTELTHSSDCLSLLVCLLAILVFPLHFWWQFLLFLLVMTVMTVMISVVLVIMMTWWPFCLMFSGFHLLLAVTVVFCSWMVPFTST